MTATIIVLSCVLWAAALAVLPFRQILAPVLSFLGLLTLSFATNDAGFPLLPVNNVILVGWLCMTTVVTLATLMQPAPVLSQTRGMGYILAGAIVGLAVGLLGFTVSSSVSMLYGIMIVGVVVEIFFGFLLYTNTPAGRPVNITSGFFFKYLLAKGFPTAITVMQIGVVLVLLIAIHNF